MPDEPSSSQAGLPGAHTADPSPAGKEPSAATAGDGGGAPDVFVSYASSDRAVALAVAKAVAARGWSVWIDRWRLLGGAPFRTQIDQALRAAGAVLVLWSKTSAARTWVAAEATVGGDRQVLVSARLDGTQPPLPFSEYQIRDLSDWDGEDQAHPGLVALMGDVAHVLKREVPVVVVAQPAVQFARSLQAVVPLVLAALLVVLVVVWFRFRLGVSAPVALAVPLFAAVLGWLVKAAGREELIGHLAVAFCRPPALALLAVGVLGLWCLSALVVQGPEGKYYPLTVSLGPPGPESVASRSGRLTSELRRVRWLIPTPPWGRTFQVRVEGHAPREVTLFPWRGSTLDLGGELAPRPVLLARVHRLRAALIDEAELEVEYEGAVVARTMLRTNVAALLVGGVRSLEERVPAWRQELQGWGGRVELLCQAWAGAASSDWKRTPPLDGKVRLVFTTHAGRRFVSQPFQLTGVFTDAEPPLETETR